MKILAIDARMLTPDRDYGSARMAGLLRALRELGHEVAFVADDPTAPARYAQDLARDAINVIHINADLHLRQDGGRYDIIILSRVGIAAKYDEALRRCAPKARIVFDTVDLHFVREYRAAKLSGNTARLRKALHTRELELAAARAADAIVVVSPLEKKALRRELPEAVVHVVTAAHELHKCQETFAARNGILFVGNFDHLPNLDAVQHYFNEIHPLLVSKLPGTPVFLVGGNPPSAARDLASENVIVTGHVPDLAPYFSRCRLSIAPLRFGAGIKGKLLDSFSYGVPVVASPLAAEGLPVTPDRDLIVADTPASFADAVVRVHVNEALWMALSRAGMELITRDFSPDTVRRQLSGLLSSFA